MITFLPSRSFTASVKCLDPKRLLGQVIEAKLILEAIIAGKNVGHPAYDMWRPYPGHLAIYGQVASSERHIRFGTAMEASFATHIPAWFYRIPTTSRMDADFALDDSTVAAVNEGARTAPPWLGDKRLHLSHIRALYEKDHSYYSKWKPILKIPPEYCCVGCNYWWPTHKGL